ncbi:hypothetical protein ACXYVG_00815 [Mesomycoplasma ovipneumoniae]
MVYQSDAAQLLRSTKSWAKILLIIRIVKFVLGLITLIVFIAGFFGAVGQASTDQKNIEKAVSTLLGSVSATAVMLIFWVILSFAFWILLIISPFKLKDLPARMNLKTLTLFQSLSEFSYFLLLQFLFLSLI